MPRRVAAWNRLDRDLDRGLLARMTTVAGLTDVPRLAHEIVAGQVRGRVVIDVAR
jgi:alcohol dehydrogenase/acrylyl-CoA reductase (NADPH)